MFQPPMTTPNRKRADTEAHHHPHHVIIDTTVVAVVIISHRIQIEKVAVAQVDRVVRHIGRRVIITIIHHHHHANQSIRTKIRMMTK